MESVVEMIVRGLDTATRVRVRREDKWDGLAWHEQKLQMGGGRLDGWQVMALGHARRHGRSSTADRGA